MIYKVVFAVVVYLGVRLMDGPSWAAFLALLVLLALFDIEDAIRGSK